MEIEVEPGSTVLQTLIYALQENAINKDEIFLNLREAQRFLEKKIKFLSIASVVEKTLNNSSISSINSIKDVIEVDKDSRDLANSIIKSGSY